MIDNSPGAPASERVGDEVASEAVGEEALRVLRDLDLVAYVRFASVYRQFKDISQFMDEVKHLIKDDKPAKVQPAKPKASAKR